MPEDLRSHPDLWLLVELSLSNKHMLEVVAGGQSVPVEFHQIPTWQELFIKLPPLQQNLDLEFKAIDEEALFTIRKIALYR